MTLAGVERPVAAAQALAAGCSGPSGQGGAASQTPSQHRTSSRSTCTLRRATGFRASSLFSGRRWRTGLRFPGRNTPWCAVHPQRSIVLARCQAVTLIIQLCFSSE